MSKIVQIGKQVVYNGQLMPANTPFEVDEKHFKELQRAGAWEVDQATKEHAEQVELGDRTVAELKELARDLGITVKRGWTKSQLVGAIVEAQGAEDEEDADDEDANLEDEELEDEVEEEEYEDERELNANDE